jgi:hypothetical protein
MRTRLATAAGTVAAVVALLAVAGAPTASADVYPMPHGQTSGDCTMLSGAQWTLNPDGTADFQGTVTSSHDNDAWLMWVYLVDRNQGVMGMIHAVQDWNTTKFVRNLPDHRQRYDWTFRARFNPSLYPRIRGIEMEAHC